MTLKDVEKLLNITVNQHDSAINAAGAHILSSGGKRIRPFFVLLSGSFGSNQQYLTKTATALELIHMASLVHDDYIDNSDTRRGALTIHQLYNHHTAVQTGHYFLAAALDLVSDIPNEAFHRYFASVIQEVVYGEFEQMADRFHTVTFRQYLRRINRKTAILLEASCKLGAMSTNADERIIYHLGRFGHFMGMSFQIIDDILDYTSTEEALGKPVGSDIRNGHMTLPLMCASQYVDVTKSMQSGNYDELIALVKAYGIEDAKALSRMYAGKASEHLQQLPDTSEKLELAEILDKMTHRAY